jgi:hypothetical protein
MARVKFSALLSEINGSIGGSTFQRSAYGYSLRNKPIPVSKPTVLNQAIRQSFFQASRLWSNMSDVDRIFWRNAVEFYLPRSRNNKNSYLSAYSYFMQIVPMALFQNLSLSYFTKLEPFDYRLKYSGNAWYASQIDIYYMGGAFGDYTCLVEASRPFATMVRFDKKSLRLFNCLHSEQAVYLGQSYVDYYGALPSVGEFINLRLRVFGLNSPSITTVFEGCIQITL